MVSALPGITSLKPGSAQVPMPGISIGVVDDDGVEVGNGEGGLLVVTEPWPSMLRGIWGDMDALCGDLLVEVRLSGVLLRRRRRAIG